MFLWQLFVAGILKEIWLPYSYCITIPNHVIKLPCFFIYDWDEWYSHLQGLAMAMHKIHEGPAVFEMLNNAQELASRENRVTEERKIRILIAQMHVVQVNCWSISLGWVCFKIVLVPNKFPLSLLICYQFRINHEQYLLAINYLSSLYFAG